ncbi:MAG: FKBP-type peptidyl-prolyl cis-trans isomerase [Vampirovibrionales bacterium]|nr:FKBP-type peptidyl-prolyl cis-trans isomerase [Vampirovibrionales bacterium]
MQAMQRMGAIGLGVLLAGSLMVMTGCDKSQAEGSPDASNASGSAAAGDLQIQDVKVGTGDAAKDGDNVKVQYVGTLYPDGKKFDSSYDHGEAFTFKLGSGQVIKGWDEGVVGMREGGKRVLIVPPDMAYGENGFPPVIPKRATLKFEVELLEVQ